MPSYDDSIYKNIYWAPTIKFLNFNSIYTIYTFTTKCRKMDAQSKFVEKICPALRKGRAFVSRFLLLENSMGALNSFRAYASPPFGRPRSMAVTNGRAQQSAGGTHF